MTERRPHYQVVNLLGLGGKPLTALFDKIHKEMPPNKPGTLSPEASADLLAYVLQFNKFSGGRRLSFRHDTAALNQIRYESKKPNSKK